MQEDPMPDIHTLVEHLRQPGARTGTGIWFLPEEYLGKELSIAGKINLQPVDAPRVYLDSLPNGARFSGLTRPDGYQNLLNFLRTLAGNTHLRDCLLVHTFDLLLLGLASDQRDLFWQGALEGIPYPRTKMILALPEKGSFLISSSLTQRFASQIAWGKLE